MSHVATPNVPACVALYNFLSVESSASCTCMYKRVSLLSARSAADSTRSFGILGLCMQLYEI